MADGVDDPEERDVEVAFASGSALLDGGHDFVDVEAGEVVEDADGDVDLGVADALGGEVAEHVVGDGLVVGGGVEALGDGLEAHEEAGEVGVGVDLAGGFEGERGGVVAERKLDERLGSNGAFEMQVELSLGEAAEPEFGVDGCEGFRAGHRSSVVVGWGQAVKWMAGLMAYCATRRGGRCWTWRLYAATSEVMQYVLSDVCFRHGKET